MSTGPLHAVVRERKALSADDVARMYALYATYYDGTSCALFADDLAGKSHVIELTAEGMLVGFSTLAVLPFEYRGWPNLALFSGDTIIDQSHWGEQALVAAFCRFAGRLRAQRDVPLYWLLISKGYRTYRYLSLFARTYYPQHVAPTPAAVQERLDELARRKFGAAYDAASGIVRFPQSRGHLKPAWADVREHLQRHEVVRFFLDRNPGYASGDELVCLTELAADNLRSFARRAFVEGLHAAAEGVPA
jgi:hypothetical protein